MDWKKLLAYVTGSIDQELLLRNEYLVAENRILRAQIKARQKLNDGERTTLAEIGGNSAGGRCVEIALHREAGDDPRLASTAGGGVVA